VSPELAQLAAAVVGLSMVITPIGAAVATFVARRLHPIDQQEHLQAHDGEISDHVVIGGYGRVGQIVARLLTAENVPFIALDNDPETVSERRGAGERVYFGDAGRPELLMRAGAKRACAFVVTVNARLAAERMVRAAREQNPDAPIYARARDAAHAARLQELGAVNLVPETLEAALQLGGRLLEGLGLTDEAVERRLEQARTHERERIG
jgi:CPA2 family monovalent cation:H+ antiporter-2